MPAKILIKEVMDKTGYTLTRIVEELNMINETPTTIQNISNKLNRNTIKFSEVETILSIMGYTISPIPVDINMMFLINTSTAMFNSELANKVINFVNNPDMPYRAKMQLRNILVHSNRSDIENVVSDFINYNTVKFGNMDKYF